MRARLAAGSCFFTDLLIDVDLPPEALQEALWDLAWAGEVTNDAFAPLRAPRLTLARAQRDAAARAGRSGRRFSSRRGGAQAQVQGRWSLTAALFEVPAQPVDPSARRRALAELLLERHGILTRELVLAEGVPGGFSAIYPELSQLETLGVARRGYFVEGLGGAQFALPGAVERLRAQQRARGGAAARARRDRPGAALRRRAAMAQARRRDAPAVAARPARPSCSPAPSRSSTWSAAARRCRRSSRPTTPRIPAALQALADHARAGRLKRIALEKVDGEPVMGTPLGGGAHRGRLPRRSAQADAERLARELASARCRTASSFAQIATTTGERFQQLRRELGVSTFGMNLITLEPGQAGRIHRHEHQEEVYLVLGGAALASSSRARSTGSRRAASRASPRLCAASSSTAGPSGSCCWRSAARPPTRAATARRSRHGSDSVGRPPQETPLPDDVPVDSA